MIGFLVVIGTTIFNGPGCTGPATFGSANRQVAKPVVSPVI